MALKTMKPASNLFCRTFAIASICGAPFFLTGCDNPPLVDIHGDLLPRGATARLGTTRLRPERPIWSLAYSPDGKWIASASISGSIPCVVEIWEVATGRLWGVLAHASESSPDSSTIYSISWSPDSARILVGRSGKVQVWNIASLTCISEVPISNSDQRILGPIAFWIPQTDRIVGFMSPSNKLHIWNAISRKVERVVETDEVLVASSVGTAAQMTRDGRQLVLGQTNGIAFVDIETGKVKTIDLKGWEIVSLSLSAEGQKCAASVKNDLPVETSNAPGNSNAKPKQFVAVLDVGTGDVLWKQNWESSVIGAVAFAEAGEVVIATPFRSGSIKCFEALSGKERWSITAPGVAGHALAVHPQGEEFATGDRSIGFWRTSDGERVREIESHASTIVRLAIDADETVHTIGEDGRRTWRRATGKLIAWTLHPQGVQRFGEDNGPRFLRVAPDQTVELVSDNGVLWRLAPEKDFPAGTVLKNVAWSPDGRRIAVSFIEQSRDKQGGEILILDTATGDVLSRIPLEFATCSLKFAPNGKLLGWAAPNVRVWDVDENRLVLIGVTSASLFSGAFAFSPDSAFVVMPISDDSACNQLRRQGTSPTPADKCTALELWNLGGKEQVWQSEPMGAISAIAVSPDRRFAASATWERDYPVYVWSLETGKELARFGGHRDLVRVLEFSKSGRYLISGGQDTTGLVWDLEDLH